MKKPKIIIIYESYHHNNTEKIAFVLAQKMQADLYKTDNVNINNLLNYDIIGFGTGLYFCKPHQKMHPFLDCLPALTGRKFFLFTTSGIINKKYTEGIINKIVLKIEEKGLDFIDYFSVKGWDTFGLTALIGGINRGHPDLNDFYEAEIFANTVLSKL